MDDEWMDVCLLCLHAVLSVADEEFGVKMKTLED